MFQLSTGNLEVFSPDFMTFDRQEDAGNCLTVIIQKKEIIIIASDDKLYNIDRPMQFKYNSTVLSFHYGSLANKNI